MTAIIIAWVLVIDPATRYSTAVPGIANEAACETLAKDMKQTMRSYKHKCFSYEKVQP